MSTSQIEIQIIAVLVAIGCALPGVFLVLRRMSMMSDAIAHAILPGIVVAFFFTHDISSPLLIVAAAGTGLLTSWVVELITQSRRVHEDAAIGLVFPAFFSIGVVLISKYAGDVHLDVDIVLLGELAFAPFDRIVVMGRDIGPKALYVSFAILIINLVFIMAFYKELKLATFDPGLATSLGFLPSMLHYALMGTVSMTVVGAFDVVGSILVVALIVVPPATAYLLTNRLSNMIIISLLIGAASAFGGYWIAYFLDASIAGSMAGCAGLLFSTAWLLAPGQGLVSQVIERRNLEQSVALSALTVHLLQHEGTDRSPVECQPGHLTEHLQWSEDFARGILSRANRRGLIYQRSGMLSLTDQGRHMARQRMKGEVKM